ncbi:MAG: Uncharacterized protein Greene101415_855, partial [Parcubacteria group bacterium Greene1014_15]
LCGDVNNDVPGEMSETSASNCTSLTFTVPPECSDGVDNDGDTLSDLADPGCTDPTDDNETGPPDLIVSAISRTPSGTIIKGITLDLHATIFNAGDTPVSVATAARFCITTIGPDCYTSSVGQVGGLQTVLPPLAIGAGSTKDSIGEWTALGPGTYTFRACADVNTNVTEISETNNCKSLAPFIVKPECSDGVDNGDTEDIAVDLADTLGCSGPTDDDESNPNLTITSFTVPSGAPLEEVIAKVTILNTGTAPTPTGNFEIAINRDVATLPAGATTANPMSCTLLEHATHVESTLLGEDSRSFDVKVILPATDGTFTAVAMVDSDCAVTPEVNESAADNMRSTTFTVTTPVAQPNLTITAFTVPNGTPGQTVTASVTIRNNGTGPTPAAGFTVAINSPATTIVCNGAESALVPITGALAAGASRTVLFTSFILPSAPGTHTATAMVDFGCTVAETDESDDDNKSQATFVVAATPPPPAPNLIVTDITIPDDAPGAKVIAVVTVHNAGNAPTPTPFEVAINQTNPAMTATTPEDGAVITLPLAAGASRTVFISTILGAAGPKTGSAMADSDDVVTEQREIDNTLPVSFVISVPRPNLIITGFDVPNGTPGALVDVTVTVKNDGTAATTVGYEVAVNVNTSTMNCATLESGQATGGILAAGASRSHVIPSVALPSTPGAHIATALVDSDGVDPTCTITESNETDNTKNTGFSVAAFAVGTSKLDGTPKLLQKGKTVVLTVNATNIHAVSGCRLSGDNGQVWTILPNALGNIVDEKRTTLPIVAQTRFVLQCTDLNNAPMLPREVIIKLVPSFREF